MFLLPVAVESRSRLWALLVPVPLPDYASVACIFVGACRFVPIDLPCALGPLVPFVFPLLLAVLNLFVPFPLWPPASGDLLASLGADASAGLFVHTLICVLSAEPAAPFALRTPLN